MLAKHTIAEIYSGERILVHLQCTLWYVQNDHVLVSHGHQHSHSHRYPTNALPMLVAHAETQIYRECTVSGICAILSSLLLSHNFTNGLPF